MEQAEPAENAKEVAMYILTRRQKFLDIQGG
jgi:hypothetical protein